MRAIKENYLLRCILISVVVIAIYTASFLAGNLITENVIQIIMAAMLIAIAGGNAYLYMKKKLSYEIVISSVILAGFIMRIGYMLYTPCDVRSHDLWEINTDGYGHAGYLLCLIQDKTLPQNNIRQYYQQPFFYIAGSLVSQLIHSITGSDEPFALVDAAKTVSCAASCMTLILAEKICDMFGLEKQGKPVTVATVAFHPAFYLSSRVTPDMLAAFLMTVALIYTLKWYDSPDWKNTLILAVTYGLAVMTKLSAAVVALFTAAVFIVKLIQLIKQRKFGHLIPKFLVFGTISIPAGLWFNVRNYLKFGQEFGYVLSVGGEESRQYVGNHSLIQRFIIPDFRNLLSTPYANIADDYNFFAYSLKTSLFGEFTYSAPSFVPILLLFSALILCVIAIVGAVSAVKHLKDDKKTAVLTGVCVLFLISIISFNIKFPHACSMDYRYMSFITIPFAVVLSKYMMRTENRIFRTLLYASLSVYSCASCLMYVLI